MTSFMLEYCKAVDRQIWPHQHPLRQFDKDISLDVRIYIFSSNALKFNQILSNVCVYIYIYSCCLAQILRKLEERGADLDHLQEMQDKDIGVLIRYAPGGRVLLY